MNNNIVDYIAKEFYKKSVLSEEACMILSKTAMRILLESISQNTNWHMNRYNTDNEFVAHFWREDGEQKFDIRVSKKDE